MVRIGMMKIFFSRLKIYAEILGVISSLGGISIQYWMTGMGKIHWTGWGMDTVRIQGTLKY